MPKFFLKTYVFVPCRILLYGSSFATGIFFKGKRRVASRVPVLNIERLVREKQPA